MRTGKWGNEGKIPWNKSILVVTKFTALHYVKCSCKPSNPSGGVIAFAAGRNKVKISAFIVIKASSLCGQRNKTLKIWQHKKMTHPTRVKLKNNLKNKVKYLLVFLIKPFFWSYRVQLLGLLVFSLVILSLSPKYVFWHCTNLNQNVLSVLLNAGFYSTVLWNQVIWELQSNTRLWL